MLMFLKVTTNRLVVTKLMARSLETQATRMKERAERSVMITS